MVKKVKYPIGIQSFSEIIEGGYLYVDKTAYIRELVDTGKYYFLSRPRRFGKSLLLTTIQSYFEGIRELFRGLDIESDDREWAPHPVILLSLNMVDPKSERSLLDFLNDCLVPYENLYGRNPEIKTLSQRFANIIVNAHEKTGQKVVVLVDEYDAPLLSTLDMPELNENYLQTLKAIFSVLKPYDRHIEFALITGVSRFSHTSLFSGANNLTDISFDQSFAAICGITEEEVISNFGTSINELSKATGSSEHDVLRNLKENFDGYHFCQNYPDIYNPYSLLSAFKYRKISDYWFQSGTPSYLIRMLKREDFFLPDLDNLESMQSSLSVKESYLNNPVALLFETGYITIKDYDDEKQLYTLGLPNKEVAESFSKALMPIYSGYPQYECDNLYGKMRNAVVDGEPDRFMEYLRVFLEGNPYGNTEIAKREAYFRNNIYLIFRALGFLPRAEERTCWSRMDVMLQTRRFIYIFELKTDGKVSEAMRQIDRKCYAEPYLHSGKKIFRIAANYSTERNNIIGWEIESQLS